VVIRRCISDRKLMKGFEGLTVLRRVAFAAITLATASSATAALELSRLRIRDFR